MSTPIKIYSPLLVELATISAANSAVRKETINADNILNFSLRLRDPSADYINSINVVGLGTDYFDIAWYKKEQQADGTMMINVECEQVSYRLCNSAYAMSYFSMTDTPTNILTALLAGTDFTVGTVDFASSITFTAELTGATEGNSMSLRSILMQLVNQLGGEVEFSAFSVSILTARGSAGPVVLTVGQDITMISEAIDKRLLDSLGNPTAVYTVGIYDGTAVELGDVVQLTYSTMGISESLRIVSKSYDPYNPKNVSIEVGNYTKTIENLIYDIQTTKASADYVSALEAAVTNLNEVIANSLGYYKTDVVDPLTGAVTTYIHDASTLATSVVIYCMTGRGFAWTDQGWNGGTPTWQYGITGAGNAILNILTVLGINADWINAGQVAAARLSIGADSTFAAGYNPTLIEVGGRNLLLNSGTQIAMDGYGAVTFDYLTDYMNEGYVVKITNPEHYVYINPIENYSDLKKGEHYILSVRIMAEGSGTGNQKVYLSVNSGDYVSLDGTITTTKFNTLTRDVIFMSDTIAPRLHFDFNGFEVIYLSTRIKLEKGNKATDWSPAPEDVDASIATSQTTAQNNLAQKLGYTNYADMVAKATAGQTIIDGGYINTDLLEAHSVLADKIVVGSDTSFGDGYDPTLITVGATNLLLNSSVEKTSANEHLFYENIASIFDLHGVGQYTFSFDVKSTVAGDIHVYCADRATDLIKYIFPLKTITVTTGFQRYSVTVDVTLNNGAATHTSLAFYGGNYTGRIPSVKNVKIEKGNKATDWSPAPADLGIAGTTVIDGANITTGKLQSVDGKTYFDLTNSEIYQSATIGGKTAVYKTNPTVGVELVWDGKKVFGVDTSGRIFTNAMSNVDDSGYYMTYGYGGSPGLECFAPIGGSTPVRFFGIAPDIDGGFHIKDMNAQIRGDFQVNGTTAFYDQNNYTRLVMASNGATYFRDGNGKIRFHLQASGINDILATNGEAVFASNADGSVVELTCATDNTQKLGVDATGPYYVKSGAKTYF